MKRSALCFSAFPFDNHFEIHLQKGSVFYICSSASNLSADKDFSVAFPISVTIAAVASRCSVKSLEECCWGVLLLVLNAGPSECVADSVLIVVGWFCGNSTTRDRQSAALLCAPNIHLKVMLYVANSSFHLLTSLFTFFSLEILLAAYGHFSSLKVVIPFS